jgi:hypothetical protein
MLNPKILKYMNYQFGDKVDEMNMYAGIYNNNILLIGPSNYENGNNSYPLFLHKSTPTLNELKNIYSELKKKSLEKWYSRDYLVVWYSKTNKTNVNIKKLPTINELKFIEEQCKKYPNSIINQKLPFNNIKYAMHVDNIKYAMHVDHIYYRPSIIKPYYLKIKRIPIYVKS